MHSQLILTYNEPPHMRSQLILTYNEPPHMCSQLILKKEISKPINDHFNCLSWYEEHYICSQQKDFELLCKILLVQSNSALSEV